MFSSVVLSVLALLALKIFHDYFIRDRNIPPGPRRLPLIGSLHQAPKSHELPWYTYASWARKYGPIFSAQFGGSTLIFLSTAQAAHDLLSARGAKYSDRPRFVMANECMEKGMHIMLKPYNAEMKLHQRMEGAVLTPRASATYVPLQDLESKALLHDFLVNGEGFHRHFEFYAFNIVHTLTYGFRCTDDLLAESQKMEDNLVDAMTTGKWIVDIFPILNYLPRVLAPWKKIAERNFEYEKAIFVRDMQKGLEHKSWNWTKEFEGSPEAKKMGALELAYDLGILASAGLSTTAGVLDVFVLAAVTHPDTMNEARKELDDVIGTDRLPSLDDRERLPFVQAIMQEVLRWRTNFPAAFPHYTRVEDEYLGYRIPADSTIIPLQWCMNHDERDFTDPRAFDPARWLEPAAEKLRCYTFGFGRRICPGRHIADNSVFLAIARLLWAFDIQAVGNWQCDDKAWDPRFFTRPMGLKARFAARSKAHRTIVEKEWLAVEIEKDADGILEEIGRMRTVS